MARFRLCSLLSCMILLLHSAPALAVWKTDPRVAFILDSDRAKLGSKAADWDDFNQFKDMDSGSDSEWKDMELGSWKGMAQEPYITTAASSSADMEYMRSGLQKMFSAARDGAPDTLKAAVKDFQDAANQGNHHAHSALAYLYGRGFGVEQSHSKAFLYHYFAAQGGDFHSKMSLAYYYFHNQMYEEAVKLYAELAAIAIRSLWSSKESLLHEPIRINDGFEENNKVLREYRGEEDDDFQVLQYQAKKGNAGAMCKVGMFYYLGLRGVHRHHEKALYWFQKSIQKGKSSAMELMGEIYGSGYGVQRNFTIALEWFHRASSQGHISAYNGIGYLYSRGLGVDKRNYTKARECFERAAEDGNPDGYYNLGVLYLRGKGVKKDVYLALTHFAAAASDGHLKAYYQLAKFSQKGLGVKKNIVLATSFFKTVAERGPWGSLLSWGMESYLKGDMGIALLLYTRAAEMGYEVAQSNGAWILERYKESSRPCTEVERRQQILSLLSHASVQGNDYATLLIGDAYYYGLGVEKDLERAGAVYKQASSQVNAQAMFNLGYMYEHGFGLPLDLNLAKRYYDEALKTDADAALPVSLALASLWLRRNYGNCFLIKVIDSLPDLVAKMNEWTKRIILDEGNLTLITLFACLMAVLYLRQRQRGMAT